MSGLVNAANKILKWRKDPVMFVTDNFGVEPDAWQLDVLRAFATHQRIAMKACKGPGKTALIAWCAWNFLATRHHPKIAATSISADNLADGLWTEMSKWQQKSEFLKNTFTWQKTRIFSNKNPETWWMSARTWPKGSNSTQQANTLAGLHADNLLFLLDEAGGIPDAVMAAAEAGLATGTGGSKDTKILMAGNPTHLEGPLYRATTTERHLWHLTEITADPDDPKRTPRVSVQWAREQIEKYGADNPFVLVNVFGRFPPSSLNVLLGPDEVSAAMGRFVPEESYSFMQKRLGVDVAFEGDDRTVIFPRQGLVAFQPAIMRTQEPADISARIIQAKTKWGSEMELIDDTGGWGRGVISHLNMAGSPGIGVGFASKATDPGYFNKRAEMWFLMAQWVKKGGALPNIPELARELTAPTYTLKNGKILLEDKGMIKSRIGASPDLADALALTFALPDMPGRGSGAYADKPSFAIIDEPEESLSR